MVCSGYWMLWPNAGRMLLIVGTMHYPCPCAIYSSPFFRWEVVLGRSLSCETSGSKLTAVVPVGQRVGKDGAWPDWPIEN